MHAEEKSFFFLATIHAGVLLLFAIRCDFAGLLGKNSI